VGFLEGKLEEEGHLRDGIYRALSRGSVEAMVVERRAEERCHGTLTIVEIVDVGWVLAGVGVTTGNLGGEVSKEQHQISRHRHKKNQSDFSHDRRASSLRMTIAPSIPSHSQSS
jgi:hypothetical protein